MEAHRQITNLVITGFSGTGKSLVGKEAARRLNWGFLDTDEEIVKQAGKPIAEVFRQEGEAKFRELEREIMREACHQRQTVIAIGGGAIVDPQNYEVLTKTALIVCLEAKPETIYERLFREAACSPEIEVRPLLAVDNPLERIRQLKASRQPHYAKADWTIHTDGLSISEVTEEVIRAWRLLGRPHLNPLPSRQRKLALVGEGLVPSQSAGAHKGLPYRSFGRASKLRSRLKANDDIACVVQTATQSYPIYVGYGLLDKLGERMEQARLSGTATIISDESVFSIYGNRVEGFLRKTGFVVNCFVVPPGEETKSVNSAIRIYDFLAQHRTERDDTIVALGGGMVGDLAGFVAATFLRGMPWVQVPTSLVAMVDASIGGKVGVNHPDGKNLIGAFYQPSMVLADPETLTTLPQRELTSGWAEVIKHGMILDEEFAQFLETNVNNLKKLEPEFVTRALARSAAIKAQVVSQDEKEREGKRTILNYGHTIAHSLEAATQYKRFLHGEAVAIGMTGAGKLSQRLGLLPADVVERQEALLREYGLPTSLRTEAASRASGRQRSNLKLSLPAITKAMELDKKVRGKAIRWVLLQDVGKAVIRSDVPQKDVLDVLRELVRP